MIHACMHMSNEKINLFECEQLVMSTPASDMNKRPATMGDNGGSLSVPTPGARQLGVAGDEQPPSRHSPAVGILVDLADGMVTSQNVTTSF